MLQLEVGKYYRNRNGDKVGPLKHNDNPEYPFVCDEYSIDRKGFWSHPSQLSIWDLIEEWKDKEIITHATIDSEHDPVKRPQHYTAHPSGIECIQVTRHMSFNLGNAVKYIWRADLKNGIEDLEKAVWYLQDEIAKRKGSL